MTLSEKIAVAMREVRRRRGLKQNALADLMGVAPMTLSLIETGKQTPTFETVEQFLSVLDLSPAEFFDFDMTAKADAERIADMAILKDAAAELSDDGLALAAQVVELMAETKATRKRDRRR